MDKKILINKEINDNLERQAIVLYNLFFIKKSSTKLTRGTLRDLATVTMGQSPRGSSYNESGIGEIFYQGRGEFSYRFPTHRLYTTEPKRFAEAGDVLLSIRAPVGDINVAYERCCIGRGLSAIHSQTGHQSFLLYTMLSLRKHLEIYNGEGTVFGSINKNNLNDIPINIPPYSSIEKFESLVCPMDKMIKINYEENCRLQKIREYLLPRFMSGAIDISNIEF